MISTNITIEIVTYERTDGRPYGFDTITLQIPGFEANKYTNIKMFLISIKYLYNLIKP